MPIAAAFANFKAVSNGVTVLAAKASETPL